MFWNEYARLHHTAKLMLGLLALTAPSAHAQASDRDASDSKRECINYHVRAQVLHRQAKLVEAQKAFLRCAQDACPKVIREECSEQLDSVRRRVPSVVVSAKRDERDEVNVQVVVDKQPLTTQLDGKPISLDPGLHTFRFQVSGFAPIERQVLLVEGEQARQIVVAFNTPKPQGAEPDVRPAPAAAPIDHSEPVPTHRPTPALAYALGATAVASLGGFAAFGGWGLSEKNKRQASCAPACTDREVASTRTKFIVADTFLGVALVTTALASYFYFTRPAVPLPGRASAKAAKPSPTRPFLGFSYRKRGGLLQLRGAF